MAVLLVYPEESGKWQQSKILINLKQFHVPTEISRYIFIIQCKTLILRENVLVVHYRSAVTTILSSMGGGVVGLSYR